MRGPLYFRRCRWRRVHPKPPIVYANPSNITITTTTATPYQKRLSLKSMVHLHVECGTSEGFRSLDCAETVTRCASLLIASKRGQ